MIAFLAKVTRTPPTSGAYAIIDCFVANSLVATNTVDISPRYSISVAHNKVRLFNSNIDKPTALLNSNKAFI